MWLPLQADPSVASVCGYHCRLIPRRDSCTQAASLGILKNLRLIAVNQDALHTQGTLVAAFDAAGTRAPRIPYHPVACVTDPTPCTQASPWMTHCAFGAPTAPAQAWAISEGKYLTQATTKRCLARDGPSAGTPAAFGSRDFAG